MATTEQYIIDFLKELRDVMDKHSASFQGPVRAFIDGRDLDIEAVYDHRNNEIEFSASILRDVDLEES